MIAEPQGPAYAINLQPCYACDDKERWVFVKEHYDHFGSVPTQEQIDAYDPTKPMGKLLPFRKKRKRTFLDAALEQMGFAPRDE